MMAVIGYLIDALLFVRWLFGLIDLLIDWLLLICGKFYISSYLKYESFVIRHITSSNLVSTFFYLYLASALICQDIRPMGQATE